ncbi:MAG: hypothetical protein H0X31_14945 [Nostocaceae cyanobacterium]|nr:hypothetical protein [Nostocaceae cyanobacterium]
MNIEAFWDNIYSENSTISWISEDDQTLNAAIKHFGNVKGKKALDLGCGDGSTSLFFAR